MQKKKNESKLSLPTVGVTKPNQSSKHYVSKAVLNKSREIDEKHIYFQMPSIHQNDLSLKGFMEDDTPFRKVQLRILKFYESFKQNKIAEEWDLYIKKSQIANGRSPQFIQIEDYLVKSIYRLAQKINEGQLVNSFSLSKSLRVTQNQHSEFRQSFGANSIIDHSKAILEDKTLNQRDPKLHKVGNRNTFEDKSNDLGSLLKEEQRIDPVNLLSQQNVLLEKKAHLFQRRIIELQQMLTKFEQRESDIGGETDLSHQLVTVSTLKNKYKHDSEVKSLQIHTLTTQLNMSKELSQSYKDKFDQLEAAYQQIRKENNIFKDYLKYKQLWAMATEQGLTWKVLCQESKEDITKLTSKVKMLKDKNKQLLNYFNMSNVVNPDQEEDKQDLDKIIKEFKEWLQIMAVPKVTKNYQEQQENGHQQTMGNGQIDVKYLRPNFYIFFQAYENTLLMEKNIINIRPIEYNFFLKIRVIFDNIFNAFQIAHSYKEYPSFPQFVIGFLQKYQLNSISNLLEYRKKPIESQQKITFLVNLFNKNFCNTWECDLFKSFLFEQYNLDQIFFFLDCRNQLNGGLSTPNVLGSPDPISYVKLSKALKVVTKKLAPYQNYIIERVKNILKNKKTVKYGESFIDKNFVLKLLIEVYALQRAKSERIFESSFRNKMRKSYITFGDFHNFMIKNFNYLSSTQVAELYREIYALSSGHITYKAIHYMCGMKGLFIPLLISKRVIRGVLEQSLNNDMLLLDIQNSLSKSAVHFEELGVEAFMGMEHSLNGFMRQLEYFKDNKTAFYHRLFQQQVNVLKMNMMFLLKGSYELSPGQKLEGNEIQNHMIHLHSMLNLTNNQVSLLSRQKEKRTRAQIMLVRNFKIRIQESILQFEKVNEEQIHKLRQQINRTHSHGLPS